MDWRKHSCMKPIQNQGKCGGCWAFAATATVEFSNCVKYNKNIKMRIIKIHISSNYNNMKTAIVYCNRHKWERLYIIYFDDGLKDWFFLMSYMFNSLSEEALSQELDQGQKVASQENSECHFEVLQFEQTHIRHLDSFAKAVFVFQNTLRNFKCQFLIPVVLKPMRKIYRKTTDRYYRIINRN